MRTDPAARRKPGAASRDTRAVGRSRRPGLGRVS